jgi:hypothetical protein
MYEIAAREDPSHLPDDAGAVVLAERQMPEPPIFAPVALKLIVVTSFLPEGLSFFLFGLRLTLTRLIFLLLMPMLVLRAGRHFASARFRFVLSDLFVPTAGLWLFLAPAQILGIDEALRHSGPIALEFCFGYLVTRILLQEHGEALALARLLCGVIAVVAVLGFLDPATSTHLVRDAVNGLTGYQTVTTREFHWEETTQRYGLLRAAGPMEHSILYGLACGIALLLSLSIDFRGRRLAIACYVLGLVLSFSAGPALGVLFGIGMLAYDRIFAGLERRWAALATMTIIALVLLFTFSNAPFGFIIRHFTFDPSSGYYREYVWQLAGAKLLASPWFGIGFASWDQVAKALGISASVDALWLASALTFGIPGAVLIALGMLGSLSLPASGPAVALTPAEARLGTTLGILVLMIVLVGFTVHLWGTDWILCGLLTGMRAHLGELGRRDPEEAG